MDELYPVLSGSSWANPASARRCLSRSAEASGGSVLDPGGRDRVVPEGPRVGPRLAGKRTRSDRVLQGLSMSVTSSEATKISLVENHEPARCCLSQPPLVT